MTAPFKLYRRSYLSCVGSKIDVKHREANHGEVELLIQDVVFLSHASLTILLRIIFCVGWLLRTADALCKRGTIYVTKYPAAVHANEVYLPSLSKNTKLSLPIYYFEATY